MELDDANEMVIREALRRLGPDAQLDPAILQEQIAEVVKEQGETIFAQLNEAARQQLRRDGLRMSEQIARLGRINEAIEYGRFLITTYKVKTLGELPQKEQREFARLWRTPRAARRCRRIERFQSHEAEGHIPVTLHGTYNARAILMGI